MTKLTDRGPVPVTKARFRDEFELIAFRHVEFRRTSNPDAARLKVYEPIIAATSASFFRKSKKLCMDHMMEVEDLKTFATMWTCNYIGLYELPQEAGDQNFKLLRAYLSQRFNELRNLLWRKGRNIFVHYDEAHIAFTGVPYNFQHSHHRNIDKTEENETNWISTPPPFEEPETVDKEYLIRHRGYESNSVLRRRQQASERLQSELSSLSHEKLLEVLGDASENVRIHPDAQKAALDKLKEHKQDCEICLLEKDKQVTGV